jgi:hypothetical protein
VFTPCKIIKQNEKGEMIMNRKTLALILALIFAFSMSTVALAADSQNVTIQAIQKNVYDTEINWDGFHFTYNFNEEAWDHTTATVTVKNKSTNTAITVSCGDMTKNENLADALKENVGNVTLTCEDGPTQLDVGDEFTFSFTIGNAPTKNENLESTLIGTVAVTVS